MSRTGKAVLYVLSGGALSVAFALAGADQADAAPPPTNDKAVQQAKDRIKRANPEPAKAKPSPAHGTEEKKRASQQAGRARAATPEAKKYKAPAKKPQTPKKVKPPKAAPPPKPKPAPPPAKPKGSPAHGTEEKKRAFEQTGRARAATPEAKQDKKKRDEARRRVEKANPEPPKTTPKAPKKPNTPKNVKAPKTAPPPKPSPVKPKGSPAHGTEEKKRAFEQAGRARAATPEAKQDKKKRDEARRRIEKANPEPVKTIKFTPRYVPGAVPLAVPKKPSTAPRRPAGSPAHGTEEKKRAFEQTGRARAATPEAKQNEKKRDEARRRIDKANPDPGAAHRTRDQRNARVRLASSEGQAARESLTGQQFDAQRASADVAARAAVTRRVAYAESQLGGAPGAGAARARSAVQVKIAQGQVDYHDALAGRPVGERVGKVVESVAPGLSRITDTKTGSVSLNNFRLGPNAPSQDRLIPALSAAAVENAKQCGPDDGCHPKPTWLTYSTARDLTDLCRDTDCREDFAEELVATLVGGGVQPPAGENPRDVLWTLAAAEGATRGTANMKGPPKPLSVRQNAPRAMPEPAAPRRVTPPAGPANSSIGPKSVGAAQGPRYERNPKHGATQRGNISPEPTNGQASLSVSVQVKSTSPRRVGVDPKTGEYIVFDQHREGLFHGHVRSWSGLTSQMQNALKRAGMVNGRGKIIVGGN